MRDRSVVLRLLPRTLAVVSAAAAAGCTHGDESSTTISAEGFDGVRAGMTVAAVEREWNTFIVLFPNDGASGATIATAAICDGAVRGLAGFWAFPPLDET